MRKLVVLSIISFLFCASLSAQKYTLAIIDLKASGVDEYIAIGVTDLIRTELHNSGLFNIIERSEMDNVLKKHNLKAVTCSEMDCAVKIGQILTADMILVGSVIKFGESMIINARLIDVKKVQIEFAEKAKVTNISYLDAGAEEFASRIVMRMGGQTPPSKQKYLARRDIEKNYKIGYVSDVIQDNEVIKLDIGYLENVKERNIYEIRKKQKKIAWCVVKEVGEYESVCGIIRKFDERKIERGDKAFYKGQDKIGGLTVFAGTGTPLKGLNDFNQYYFMPGIHFGVSFDIILKSGLGFQFNLSWLQLWDHHIYDDYDDYWDYKYMSLDINYVCPFFIKYNFSKSSYISPYIGIGLSLVIYRYYSYNNSCWICDYTRKYKYGPAPVLCWGFNFFSYRRFNFVLDYRYYIGMGAPKFEGKRPAASALIFSLGFHVSI